MLVCNGLTQYIAKNTISNKCWSLNKLNIKNSNVYGILLGDKNATSLSFNIISTLIELDDNRVINNNMI